MSIPPRPTLSLSYSALRRWAQCERAWWLTHVGAWQGWPGGAAAGTNEVPTQAALAYRGKHLVTPDQAFGIVLHELAAEVVRAIRDARRPPTADWLEDRLRTRLRAVWTRPRAAFVARPKERMLLDHYRGHAVAPHVRERVRAKASAAITRLLTSDAVADLGNAARGEVLCADSVDSVMFPGERGDPPDVSVPLYAAPDVVLVSATASVSVDGVRFPPPVVQLIDWKCTTSAQTSDARRQLAIYAVYAEQRYGLTPHPAAGYVGRVVDLSPRGDPEAFVLIGARDMTDARAWLSAGLATLRARADAELVMAKARTTPRADRTRCVECGLADACRMDREAWDGSADDSTSRL